ncbi:MAG: hypothetical protein J6Q55_00380, partial [Clostridia bacterium]|nr:hypothetical protein [Clostridia bacterium]
VGRVKTYEAIVKGENIPDPGIPESFKVLIKELQSLALDVKVLSADREEIIVRDSTDDEADYNEIMLAEQEQRKQAISTFSPDDEIALGDEDATFTEFDDDFSLDSLFDDDADSDDALSDLFADEEGDDEEGFDDEENFDLGDLFGDDEDDNDDLFGDETDEDND